MRPTIIHHNAPLSLCLIFLIVTGAPTLLAQARRPAAAATPTVAEMEPLFVRIATFRDGQSRDDLIRLLEFVRDSSGSPSQLRSIEDRFLRFLQSDATAPAKTFVFEQLSVIATEASIPVLTPMFQRTETAEQARYVLARIPGPAADEALRKSLANTRGRVKIGIVNSLGQRRDAQAVPAISALLSPSDAEIAEVSAAALGKIGNGAALSTLAAARSKTSGTLREHVSEAYVTCADQLAKGGGKAAGMKVYRELIAAPEYPGVRVQALAGLAAAEGKSAIPALTAAIESKDARVQTAALAFLAGIPGPESTHALAAVFPKLPVSGQVRALAALVDRNAASAATLASAAINSPAAELRAAGLDALGRLGDESSVIVLAESGRGAGRGAKRSAAEFIRHARRQGGLGDRSRNPFSERQSENRIDYGRQGTRRNDGVHCRSRNAEGCRSGCTA
jgi:HEAT repeat protein